MKPLIGTPLKRFLRDYRKDNPPARQVAALLQSVEFPVNVGSIFRMAEAAGIAPLVLSGITPQPGQPTLDKVARHKTERVDWRYEADAVAAIRGLHDEGFQVIALEITHESVPYHTYSYGDKVCFVAGHEDHGVTKATLAACDGAVFIPMYGKGRSLNVHVALSIAVYHALQA